VKIKNTGCLVLLAVSTLLTSQSSFAERQEKTPDMAEGKVLFVGCTGCHSLPGYANTSPRYQVPKLGGQKADYLVAALNEYAEGTRQHASMKGNADSLPPEDRQKIAAYLSWKILRPNSNKIVGDIKAGEAKAVACAGCHGQGGNSTIPGYPRLDGQYQSYLIKAMQDYQSGKRKNPMMTGMVAALSEADITNLSAYYASQEKGLYVTD